MKTYEPPTRAKPDVRRIGPAKVQTGVVVRTTTDDAVPILYWERTLLTWFEPTGECISRKEPMAYVLDASGKVVCAEAMPNFVGYAYTQEPRLTPGRK